MDANLKDLFNDSGLDDPAIDGLLMTANHLGPAIMAGLGNIGSAAIKSMHGSDVVLINLLVDDSPSIGFQKPDKTDNIDVVIKGHNHVIASLHGAKTADVILVSCQYLNGGVLYPFVPLEKAVEMSRSNYRLSGMTPLYDRMAVVLAGTVAKATELEKAGVSVRSSTYVVTDGVNQGSRTHHSPESVAPIVEGLVRMESHVVGAMGIDDGYTDFRDIFGRMGIPSQWHLTPANTEAEIRAGFGAISESAMRVSQTAGGSFSQTAMGGFGN